MIRQKKVSKKSIKKLVLKLSQKEKNQVSNVEDIMLDVSERYR